MNMKKYWNTHYIRQSRHETVAGVPDILFFLPENSGGTDCLIPVPQEKIDDMKLECQDAEEENVFQEYFEYLMELRASSILQDMMRHSLCFHI